MVIVIMSKGSERFPSCTSHFPPCNECEEGTLHPPPLPIARRRGHCHPYRLPASQYIYKYCTWHWSRYCATTYYYHYCRYYCRCYYYYVHCRRYAFVLLLFVVCAVRVRGTHAEAIKKRSPDIPLPPVTTTPLHVNRHKNPPSIVAKTPSSNYSSKYSSRRRLRESYIVYALPARVRAPLVFVRTTRRANGA